MHYQNQAAWEEAEKLIQQALKNQSTELNLDYLRLRSLPNSIIELAPHLTRLSLANCDRLLDVSSLKYLNALNQLDLTGCQQLTQLDCLAELKGLQQRVSATYSARLSGGA